MLLPFYLCRLFGLFSLQSGFGALGDCQIALGSLGQPELFGLGQSPKIVTGLLAHRTRGARARVLRLPLAPALG